MVKKKYKLKRNIKEMIVLIILLIIVLLSFILIRKKGLFLNKINIEKQKKTQNLISLKMPKYEESNELSMVMVGDCLIHSYVYESAKTGDNTYSFASMFTEVSPLIANHDLAYYNQETIIGGKSLGLSNYPRFNSPEEIGDDMVDLGFNLVSLANNHTLDKNEIGVINSVTYWKTKPGVYYTGQAISEEDRTNNIKVYEKNGIKYAFFSYTTTTNGLLPPAGKEYLTNIYSYDKAKQDIDKVKGKADLIIVAMHWGEEYTTYPNQNQKNIAQELSDLGVNLIIGNHAHSIQPVEMINDTLVFYALGNFISAQDTKDRLTGALVSLNIKKEDSGKITFNNIEADLIYTYFKGKGSFKIYPYTMIDDSILYNKDTYYNKYKEVLTRYSDIVKVK